jgi:hypothetical protein
MAAMAANCGLMPILWSRLPGPHVASRFDGARVLGSLDRVVFGGAPLLLLGDNLYLHVGLYGVTLSIGDVLIVIGCLLVATRLAGIGVSSHD